MPICQYANMPICQYANVSEFQATGYSLQATGYRLQATAEQIIRTRDTGSWWCGMREGVEETNDCLTE